MRNKMSIPKPDADANQEVEGEVQVEQREAAVAEDQEVATTSGNTEVSTAKASEAFDPIAYLAEMGIDDIELDFSSFPTIVLNNGVFEKNKVDIGTEFEFIYLDKRTEWVTVGQEDRDSDPVMIYSNDGKVATRDGRLLTEWIAEWEKNNWMIQPLSPNLVVMVKQVGGDDDGAVVQLRLPKTSIHPYHGFLVTLAMARKNPKTVVTRAVIGAKLGTGQRSWTPWSFKLVE